MAYISSMFENPSKFENPRKFDKSPTSLASYKQPYKSKQVKYM